MPEYQPAFRRNYELWAAGMWLLFSGMAWLVSLYSLLPSVFFYWMMGICGLMSLLRAKPGVFLYS